jgi:flagellar L-ring protein precursor FlgH
VGVGVVAGKLLVAAALLSLTACATIVGDVRPFEPIAPFATHDQTGQPGAAVHPGVPPVAAPAPAYANTGSIYASAANGPARNMYLFEDNKASQVGDLLTIVLVEATSSRSVAQTSVSKESGIGLGAPTLAGVPVTYEGQSILQAEVEAGREFEGQGNSTQSNRLEGEITVQVVRDLGNGNLLVAGQKQLRLNQGDELVQVQGIVRVADIGPDNRITSDRVGNARIVYGGRGTLARSNAMGWLGRFFNSAAFPY